jgi:hypothetical protein
MITREKLQKMVLEYAAKLGAYEALFNQATTDATILDDDDFWVRLQNAKDEKDRYSKEFYKAQEQYKKQSI